MFPSASEDAFVVAMLFFGFGFKTGLLSSFTNRGFLTVGLLQQTRSFGYQFQYCPTHNDKLRESRGWDVGSESLARANVVSP